MSAATGTIDARQALGAPDLAVRVAELGFDDADAPAVLAAARAALDRPAELSSIQTAAERLAARVGDLTSPDGALVWDGLEVDDAGVLALLPLLVSAPAVAWFHAERGVPADVSAATLADLGQQTRVHRLVSGTFGNSTYVWLAAHVWTGGLYRLGRLQLELDRVPTVSGGGEEWVLSTHIPRTGPLTSDAVDASLAVAPAFFAEHFPEVPATDVCCRSWMLDPRLPDLLPGSNLASFQQRWHPYGVPTDGDADARFFAFATRGAVDLDDVAGRTSLQRALLSVWRSGEHWCVVAGRLR